MNDGGDVFLGVYEHKLQPQLSGSESSQSRELNLPHR
jgi:hypothetical protein